MGLFTKKAIWHTIVLLTCSGLDLIFSIFFIKHTFLTSLR